MPGFGPVLPLHYTGEDGHYALLKTLKRVASQNLKTLLLTIPGERVMNPDFGVGLKTFIFENFSQLTYDKISSRIESQVKKYLPYLQIQKIEYSGDEDNHVLSVTIHYRILPINGVASLALSVSN